MHVLLVGLGNFGQRWVHWLKQNRPDYHLTVVDPNPALNEAGNPFYSTLEAAIEAARPDCILNVTPPADQTTPEPQGTSLTSILGLALVMILAAAGATWI